MAANSADQTTTFSRFPTPDCVAATPPASPTIDATIAAQPSRRSSPPTAHAPAATPINASTIVGTGERIVSGGRATKKARKPSPTPAQPTRDAVSQAGTAAGRPGVVTTLTTRPRPSRPGAPLA